MLWTVFVLACNFEVQRCEIYHDNTGTTFATHAECMVQIPAYVRSVVHVTGAGPIQIKGICSTKKKEELLAEDFGATRAD